MAISVRIGNVSAHAPFGLARFVVSRAGRQADFAKRAVPFVAVEKIGRGVVGLEQIGIAIAVPVEKDGAQLASFEAEKPGFFGDIDEATFALIAIEKVALTGVFSGGVVTSVFLQATVFIEGIGFELVVEIVGHVEIQVAVQVVIGESRACGPAAVAIRDGRSRHIGEANAFVAVEHVGAKIGDKEIGISIVVVIPRATAHAVTGIGDPGRRFNETSVCSVAVERIARRLGRYVPGQIGSVDDVEIHVPVAIVIKKSSSRAKGFHPVFPT